MMASIYQYSRNGTTVNSSSSDSNKAVPTSIRGRTESPAILARYQMQHPSPRNPPERISANPIETQRQSKINSLASSYLNNAQQQSVRRLRVEDHEQQKLAKLKQQQVISGNIASTKERLGHTVSHKYLGNCKKPVDLEERFASMRLNGGSSAAGRPKEQQYNIITHETIGSSSSSGGANGSLLKASQSKSAVLTNGISTSQFYPAQQQPQQPSYKIPSLPSKLQNGYSVTSTTNPTSSPSCYTQKSESPSADTGDSSFSHELMSRGIVGLKNLGNTCFMNSVLQCLSNTRCLLEYCITNNYKSDLNTTMSVMKGSLFSSYASLIKQMWSGGSIVSLQDFKSQLARFAPRFVGYQQQDAEEFLYYLIKGLHEDVNLIRKRPSPFNFDEKAWDRMSDKEKSQEHWSMNLRTDNSRISDMFVGQLKSTLKCTKCDYKSPTYELFWHLAVPIPTKQASTHLDDCIKLFMSEEILDGENKPTCSRCNAKRTCTKRYTIEKLPNILVIHLKRFLKIRYNNKISLNVDYPIESLDMSKYLSNNVDSTLTPSSATSDRKCIYDLYGISLHSGTESSGHYVAYCKHPYRNRWNYFNDSSVREISKSSLQDANAYILFYQLRS